MNIPGTHCTFGDYSTSVIHTQSEVVIHFDGLLGHVGKHPFECLHMLALYTNRWFMNHCPVHVTRVMLSGIQLRELILHT